MVELIPIQAIPVIAGGAGGGVLGLLNYFKVWKNEDFSKKKFVTSLLPAILTGLASGMFTSDYVTAFAAGLVGKAAWETYKQVK